MALQKYLIEFRVYEQAAWDDRSNHRRFADWLKRVTLGYNTSLGQRARQSADDVEFYREFAESDKRLLVTYEQLDLLLSALWLPRDIDSELYRDGHTDGWYKVSPQLRALSDYPEASSWDRPTGLEMYIERAPDDSGQE